MVVVLCVMICIGVLAIGIIIISLIISSRKDEGAVEEKKKEDDGKLTLEEYHEFVSNRVKRIEYKRNTLSGLYNDFLPDNWIDVYVEKYGKVSPVTHRDRIIFILTDNSTYSFYYGCWNLYSPENDDSISLTAEVQMYLMSMVEEYIKQTFEEKLNLYNEQKKNKAVRSKMNFIYGEEVMQEIE